MPTTFATLPIPTKSRMTSSNPLNCDCLTWHSIHCLPLRTRPNRQIHFRHHFLKSRTTALIPETQTTSMTIATTIAIPRNLTMRNSMQPCCFRLKNSARSHCCCPLIDSMLKRGQTTTN